MKEIIMVVDDVNINRMILSEILSDTYQIVEASDGVEALEMLKSGSALPAVVLLDIVMPNMDGHDVLRHMKANPDLEHIPVLFITASDDPESETKALQEGAMDYIAKPFNPSVVKARVDNHVQLSKYQNTLEEMVEQKTSEISSMHMKILDMFATIIEFRSLESGLHIQRTMELTKILIESMLRKPKFKMQLDDLDYEAIIKAVPLHDIGKVGIPDEILLKPARLTEEEFEVIKTHVIIGGHIIDSFAKDIKGDHSYLKHGKDIAVYHHERWDGTGYCEGLKGENIPLSARIVSVVDVYDALVSKRCYKDSMPHDVAIGVIVDGRGSQFDPDIVDSFLAVAGKIQQAAIDFADTN
jgi:putative two-component system response regulator